MGITQNQDIPEAGKKQSEGWSARTLLSISHISKSIVASFQSPFEWLFAFCLFVIASAELSGRDLSWFFYTIGFVLLFCIICRRLVAGMKEDEEKEKKKK